MKQKFRKLTFVQTSSGQTCIVDGTYSLMYGGGDIKNYGLFIVEDGRIVNRCSWYHEDSLTQLPDQDREKAEDMIEEYHLRRNHE